jgi:hypothetical protein
MFGGGAILSRVNHRYVTVFRDERGQRVEALRCGFSHRCTGSDARRLAPSELITQCDFFVTAR